MAKKPDAHAAVQTSALPGEQGKQTTSPESSGSAPRGMITNPTLRTAQPPVQARTAPQPRTQDAPATPQPDPLEQSLIDLRGQLAAVAGLPQYAAEQEALQSQIFQTEQTLNARRT